MEGRLRNTLGILEWSRGEFEEALGHFARARDIFAMLGDQVQSRSQMLNSLGAALRDLGRHEDEDVSSRRPMRIHHAAGQSRLEGHALALLGDVRSALGDPATPAVLRAGRWRFVAGWAIAQAKDGCFITLRGRSSGTAWWSVAASDWRKRRSIATALNDPELMAACDQLRLSPGAVTDFIPRGSESPCHASSSNATWEP